MDDLTKCEVYTKLLNSLSKDGDLKEAVSISAYSNQLKLIKNDLVSKVESDQHTALQMLQILIDNSIHSVHSDVIHILSNDSVDQRVKESILESISNFIKDLIRSRNVIDLASLYTVWQAYNVQQFAVFLKEVCYDSECSEDFKKFLFSVLVLLIFNTKDVGDPKKLNYIDLALQFASVMPIASLSDEEYDSFVIDVNDYIKNISELKDANFMYWSKLWMFLVRLLGTKLHYCMSLMNKLLRVVEHAFRNSSYEQRLRGYDCWKELIDNVSLDPYHIISEKQIRLLLTPLRAKFSRQEAVIIKRFEVFVYLIEKLQDKAVLVLKEFLEFCFGDVGENTDATKVGQGRSLPELWLRSAKVLLAVIGHSHDRNEQCLEANSELHLNAPLINSTNISDTYCHVINSVAECCKLLKEVELDHHRNTIIKCLWRSLLNIILHDDVPNKDECIECVGKVLDRYLKETDSYCHSIAAIIFKESARMDTSCMLPLVLNRLDSFLNIIFSVPLSKDSYLGVERFVAMLSNLNSAEANSKVVTQFFNSFINFKTVETNVDFIADVWIFLANKLDDYARGNALDFLVWPVMHGHQLTEPVKEVSIYEHYKRLLTPFIERSDDLQLALFKHLERTLKNNPLLLKNVLSLVTMFNPRTIKRDITNVTLEILALALLIPVTTEDQRESIELYLKKMFEANLTKIHDQDTIKKLCTCLEHLLRLKHFEILIPLEEALANLPDNVKWFYGKFLTLDFLVDIFEKESDLRATEKIHRIIELLRNVKNPEPKKDITSIMPLGGRSAKIANLIKQIPQSPERTSTSPSTLRLFGKDIETHTPLKALGSQLKNIKTTPTRTQSSTPPQKKKEPKFIDDESNSKFVFIESEVKIDKDKLTDHQKETLKKRREDIPALYQDLSQSASQSFDSNCANSNHKLNETEVFKKPMEVEAIHFNEKPTDDNDSTKNDAEIPTLEAQKSTTIDLKEDSISKAEQKHKMSAKDKKAKMESELKKLSMNIVGAEDFVSAGSKRKRRDKKGDQSSEKDVNLGSEEKRKKLSNKSKTRQQDNKEGVSKGETGAELSSGYRDQLNILNDPKDNVKNSVKRSPMVKKSEDMVKRSYEAQVSDGVESTTFTNQKSGGVQDIRTNTSINPGKKVEVPEHKSIENQIDQSKISVKAEDDALSSVSHETNFEANSVMNDTRNQDLPNEKIFERKSPKEKVKTVEEEAIIISDSDVPLALRVRKEKKRQNRKSLASANVSSKELRKSRRKSLPTEKLTQSELFKDSLFQSLTPGSLKKDRASNKVLEATQSELFKESEVVVKNSDLRELTDKETQAVQDSSVEIFEPFTEETAIEASTKQSDKKDLETSCRLDSVNKLHFDTLDTTDIGKNQTVKTVCENINIAVEYPIRKNDEAAMESRENGLTETRKRKRLSSSEDDDIIESSQESSVSSLSATKLRLSISKRSIVIERSSSSETSEEASKVIGGRYDEEIIQKEVGISKTGSETCTAVVLSSVEGSSKPQQLLEDIKINIPTETVVKDGRLDEEIINNSEPGTTESSLKRSRGRPPKDSRKTIENNKVAGNDVTIHKGYHLKTSVNIDELRENVKVDSSDNTRETVTKNEESDSNNETVTIEDSSVKKRLRARPSKSLEKSVSPSSQSPNDKAITEVTPDDQKVKKRGRKRTPEKYQNPGQIGVMVNYATKCMIIDKTKSSNAEENDKCLLVNSVKQDSDTDGSNEPKKRGRPKKNRERDKELDTSGDSTTAGSDTDVLELSKKVRRKSPRKHDREDVIKDIMNQVKKQVFPEKFNESKDLDMSTEVIKRTQSQDTQTQDTESPGMNTNEVQVQLELPQKPKLTESDQTIARMDTASLSLVDLEELKGFDLSANEPTNKTVVEIKSLTESTSAKSPEKIASAETKEKDKNDAEKLVDSEDIVGPSENICVAEVSVSGVADEIAETEELVRQLADRDIEVTMEVDHHSSPVRKQTSTRTTGTPSPFETSLPSSPVTGDTPNRTSELLTNTSDISPIASKSGSEDDEDTEERKLVPVALRFDHEDVDHDAHKQKSPEKGDDAPQKIDETSPEKAEKEVEFIALGSPPKSDLKNGRDIITSVEKSSRFSWIKQGSPVSHRFFSRRKTGQNLSPSASRIKKLMSNVKPPSQSELSDEVSQEDILTFTREVPSPLAVPRSSILKRKHCDSAEEGISPCAKRKRVNFSDPCTTSKKIFIKEDTAPSQCLFSLNSDDDLDKQFLEVLAANDLGISPQTESDTIDTEPSLQVNNPLLLRDDVPIYPELVDCEESVSIISRKLTSPMFVNALLSKLNSRNIKTIGDLAKQSEVSIARLPFKTPMVANVYKALDHYYHKNFKSKGTVDRAEIVAVNGDQESILEARSSLPSTEITLEKLDVKEELSKIVKRARDENVPVETLCSLILASSDQKQILAWVKTHFNLGTRDLVEEKDFSQLVKHITETVGLPRIFEILTESLESSEDESVYFDCMIKHSIEKKPLSSLIEKRSVEELKTAIWQNVEDEIYSKKELLDTCFLPRINSIDLVPFFNKLSVVEIADIVIKRLDTEDYNTFTKIILDSTPKAKDKILENYTISELTSNITQRGTPKEIISSFTYMFLAADKEKQDLVQLFRLVSECLVGELPPSQLMELSIEFMKKIPIKD